MIFYVRVYEHMMRQFWTDWASCRFLRVGSGGHQDYESSSGRLAGRLRYEDMLKDIATQMAGILAPSSVRTTQARRFGNR